MTLLHKLRGGVTFASFHGHGHCCIDKDRFQMATTGGVKYQHTLSTPKTVFCWVQWNLLFVDNISHYGCTDCKCGMGIQSTCLSTFQSLKTAYCSIQPPAWPRLITLYQRIGTWNVAGEFVKPKGIMLNS